MSSRITPAGAGKTRSAGRGLREMSDHPRRCGENMKFILYIFIALGSPPQVRGKLFHTSDKFRFAGITPAGAGKTIYHTLFPFIAQDHPRRCGENLPPKNETERTPGSPPQVRGKPAPHTGTAAPRRITPAGAGKTHIPSIFREIFQDHPRRCGENVAKGSSLECGAGSPPQVRGKLLWHFQPRL